MLSLFDFGGMNISYYTVPAAIVLCLIPHTIAVHLAGRNYDLSYPRRTAERCAKDSAMDKAKLNQLARAKAAEQNGYESLGAYAAGVVAANAAGVPARELNALTLGYIAARALYNLAYVVLQNDRRFTPLRSVAWIVSIGLIFTLFIKAGNLS